MKNKNLTTKKEKGIEKMTIVGMHNSLEETQAPKKGRGEEQVTVCKTQDSETDFDNDSDKEEGLFSLFVSLMKSW